MLHKYLYRLDDVPTKHRAFFAKLNAQIMTAFLKFELGDKSLTRAESGEYFVVINNELIDIRRQNNDENSEFYWIASEMHNAWYSDPATTLRELKQQLGI